MDAPLLLKNTGTSLILCDSNGKPLPGRELIYHVCGLSRWRDANANDFAEALMVAKLIGMSDEGKPS
ncbi:hypothetical protein KUT57_22415 [Pseudomonas aeruginosa]|nr:hypothetical protein [Pseudomonas aeruginosa]